MIRTSTEAQDIQRRFFKDKLIEDHDARTIVSTDGRQRYFRAIEETGEIVFIRENIPYGRFHKLNPQCTEFEPTPNRYDPDITRPFTKNDLLRDSTTREYLTDLVVQQAPGSIAGSAIGTAAAVLGGGALLVLTPVGTATVTAGGAACAKAVAGVKLAGAAAGGAAAVAKGAVRAHPGAAALVGWGTAHEVYLAATDENETLRTKLAGMCDL